MTTIATDGKSMAADGRSHIKGSIVSEDQVKVRRTTDGALVGCSGSACDAEVFIGWLEKGGERPKVDGDFGSIVVRPSGIVEWYSDGLRPVPVMVPVAMGSGMDFAVGAMLAGASPERAVEITAERDVYTGGKITVLTLGEA